MQAEVEKPRVNAADGHRTAFTPCSGTWPRTVPGDHCARAATDLLVRAADPRRGQLPHSVAGKSAERDRHSRYFRYATHPK